jgi:probable rRNA maturation factor
LKADTRYKFTNKTRSRIDGALFHSIKILALGKSYDLSVSIVPPAVIKKFNLMYRGKKTATDILSFPLSKGEGEIYICPSEARKEAKKFGRSYDNFLSFLFIHGCMHLKGHDHSATMERIEAKIRHKFNI